jgi:hypothetical protein
MRGTLDDLGRILDGLDQRVSAATRRASDPGVAGQVRPVRRPAQAVRPETGESARETPTLAATDSARLVAIEMAVAGSTRTEVALRLRDEFGLQRPDPILDDVFGPGTGPESRMPWSGG